MCQPVFQNISDRILKAAESCMTNSLHFMSVCGLIVYHCFIIDIIKRMKRYNFHANALQNNRENGWRKLFPHRFKAAAFSFSARVFFVIVTKQRQCKCHSYNFSFSTTNAVKVQTKTRSVGECFKIRQNQSSTSVHLTNDRPAASL